MYKKFYSKFINANPNIKHFACHSHHYWPDVTYQATIDYWNDSAQLVDDKWGHILEKKVPETQKLICEILNLSKPENICFAANTHELLIRILSTFQINKKIKVLTTDSEFYSFSRQIEHLKNLNFIELTVVPTIPFETFNHRMITEIKANEYNLIFFSHVFFNSGVVVQNIESITAAVSSNNTVIVVDGYHGFMAVPTDLSKIQDRIFYIAGSYKYAQGGEGCCFMSVPRCFKNNPAITGWFAGFQDLEKNQNENSKNEITFTNDGYRFAGSTMDYSALYRLNATLKLFKENILTVKVIHKYVQNLQNIFLNVLDQKNHLYINRKNLVLNDLKNHGHFLAFKLTDTETCLKLKEELKNKNIITDSRGSILRFGFSIYQDESMMNILD